MKKKKEEILHKVSFDNHHWGVKLEGYECRDFVVFDNDRRKVVRISSEVIEDEPVKNGIKLTKEEKDFLRYVKHCTYGLDIGNKDEMILYPIFIPARGNGKTITSLDEYIDRRIEELMNYKRGKDEQGRN